MAWAVKASVKAVLRRARHGGASPVPDEPCDEVRGRVRLNLEMEPAFVGTVDIAMDMTLQNVRVEVHLSNDGENEPDREGGDGS